MSTLNKYTVLVVLLFLMILGCSKQTTSTLPTHHITLPVEGMEDIRLSSIEGMIAFELNCANQNGIWIANQDVSSPKLIAETKFWNIARACPTPAPGSPYQELAAMEKVENREHFWYSAPFWSPDGTKLGFYRNMLDYVQADEETASRIEVYPHWDCSVDPIQHVCPGGIIYDLHTGEYTHLNMWGLSFAPNSQFVAAFKTCAARTSEECQQLSTMGALGLRVFNLRTENVVYQDPEAVLASSSHSTNNFRWSPNGQYLCYATYVGDSEDDYRAEGRLRIAQVNTSEILANLPGLRCAWAPDSTQIAYINYPTTHLYVSPQTQVEYYIARMELRNYDLITGEEQILFVGQQLYGEEYSIDVAWSPDGKYLAFTFDPLVNEEMLEDVPWGDSPDIPMRLIILDVRSGETWETSELSIQTGDHGWIKWSPDSHKVYLSSTEAAYVEVTVP